MVFVCYSITFYHVLSLSPPYNIFGGALCSSDKLPWAEKTSERIHKGIVEPVFWSRRLGDSEA